MLLLVHALEEHTVWQLIEICQEQAFRPSRGYTLLMEPGVYFHGGWPGQDAIASMCRLPRLAESEKTRVATFRTGSMARCQGGRFVEEEQLGVAAGRHDGPFASAEFEHANEPALDLPGA